MRKNKILIISYYWPPSGGSGVQRWLNFSNHLTKLGWDITVLTAKNPNFPIKDKSLLKNINKSIKHLFVPIFEPTIFFNQKKTMLNINSKGILKRFIYWIRANLFFPDSRCFWIKKATKVASEYIKKNGIDYLITTAPPFSAHIIGLNLKNKFKIKWISDFRDPWSNFFQFKLLPMSKSIINKHKKFEFNCLQNSDLIITTAPSLTKLYSSVNKNTVTITNGFESYIEGTKSKKFLIIYAGVMNNIQNPTMLWKVLSDICLENSTFKTDLEVKMIGTFGNEIKNNLNLCSLKSKIKFLSYIEKNKLDIELSYAHLLILCSVNQNNNPIIPGKLFYYFSFKTKILAFEKPNNDVGRVLNETNSGKSFDFDNYDDLKEHIINLYQEYKLEKKYISKNYCEKYKYSNLSRKLDLILKSNIS